MMTSNLVPTTLTPQPLAAPAFRRSAQEVRMSAPINDPPEQPSPRVYQGQPAGQDVENPEVVSAERAEYPGQRPQREDDGGNGAPPESFVTALWRALARWVS
jgi:hypothetical protein